MENERKNNIIKYDNINPSILAFHEDGQNFSIIATNKDDKKFKRINEYLYFVNLEEIYLFQKRKEKLNNNYERMKIIQIPEELEKEGKLLDELLKIMTVDENLINKIKEIIKNNKILKDYVFTNDNFVKMYLLIMRIRAEIPTIIMGETGCGKTKLLQMFCFLYNCTQEYFINNGNIKKMNNFDNYIWILRFNSGTKEEDIIKFIEDIKGKIEIKEEKELEKYEEEFDRNWNEEFDKRMDKYNKLNWFIWLFTSKPKKKDIKYDINKGK